MIGTGIHDDRAARGVTFVQGFFCLSVFFRMELQRNPQWSTRAKRRKFVLKALKPYMNQWKKKCTDTKVRDEGFKAFSQARDNLMKMLRTTSWEPEKPNFNIDFLHAEFEGLDDAEGVLD